MNKCSDCGLDKDDYARIKVELVEKKSKEIIEVLYGEAICLDCLYKRYKGRTTIRVYV